MANVQFGRIKNSKRLPISNKVVREMENQTNANTLTEMIASQLGIDNIFVVNDYERHSLTTDGANKILAALETGLSIADGE